MEEEIHFDRRTWDGFILSVKRFVASEEGRKKARWLFAALILFMFGTNGLSVVNSYVARAFMTAIEHREYSDFIRTALLYVGVFAASTLVSVFYSYTEQHLALVWRVWATRQALFNYANHRVYYGLKMKGEIGNPDQRIADDVRSFTTSSLSFLLMMLNGTFTVIAFSGVMWSISPLLFLVSVLYATAGTLLTYLLGRPLVRLNYNQLDKEANFRASLIYLRANAESVALSRREGPIIELNLRNIGDLAANVRRIISINRNVGFFTTGYNWLIQIIPALIVAPMFMEGKVDFGVITQSAIAFSQLVGGFSLIVREFQSISSYAATSARLAALTNAANREEAAAVSATSYSRDEGRIAYQGLTLRSPRSGRLLIRELTIEIPHGRCALVRGKDETARAALFNATSGLWEVSEGHIVRPGLEKVLFLPELPYLPPGTVRELLMRPWLEEQGPIERYLEAIHVPEELMLETLRTLRIDSILAGFGGLDKRHYWENTLPLDEQKLLVIARVLLACPRFVFLDRPGSTLQPGQVDWVLGLLREREISYVTMEGEGRIVNLEHYDNVLELKADGAWSWKAVRGGQIVDGVHPGSAQ
jgi:vitamin B12/bleomycin/antimicrobial peptide transport system ATP-binding/permease protein